MDPPHPPTLGPNTGHRRAGRPQPDHWRQTVPSRQPGGAWGPAAAGVTLAHAPRGVSARAGAVVRERTLAALQATTVGTAGPHAPTDPPRGKGGLQGLWGGAGGCPATWTRAERAGVARLGWAKTKRAEGKLLLGARRVDRVHISRSYGPRGVAFGHQRASQPSVRVFYPRTEQEGTVVLVGRPGHGRRVNPRTRPSEASRRT